MSISAMKGLKAYEQIQQVKNISEGTNKVQADKTSAGGFGELLNGAIREVDDMQKVADEKITSFITGKGGVTTHEAMIAIEQADVAFQLMNQVRSKIVRAYEEVMRTQV